MSFFKQLFGEEQTQAQIDIQHDKNIMHGESIHDAMLKMDIYDLNTLFMSFTAMKKQIENGDIKEWKLGQHVLQRLDDCPSIIELVQRRTSNRYAYKKPLMSRMQRTLYEFYLDYLEKYSSVAKIANGYEISEETAKAMLKEGQQIRERFIEEEEEEKARDEELERTKKALLLEKEKASNEELERKKKALL